ncbi:type VI secretion system Vgr family protein [Roseateles koreensis]|uniref:Type VI secretion system Vgr family protein n=1 Tax=Roseateles koreensis TaxID=2987526 RepID=A0ABT5KWE2_9BURK|nr:type VI secretion system Vgr family protein [Roseateles koreensis]MDC8787260.1 type VI secretion system Vgr family protein [Roseateles koreensis]
MGHPSARNGGPHPGAPGHHRAANPYARVDGHGRYLAWHYFEHQRSQINLGHLVNQERQQRGAGFELRTEQDGMLRAQTHNKLLKGMRLNVKSGGLQQIVSEGGCTVHVQNKT